MLDDASASFVMRLLSSLQEEHAPLFPLTESDYFGFFFASLGLMVAAGGGVGGGGMLVPIYILVMGFSPKHAIPLSNVTVFGGAIANTVLNASKRHPLANRPLVDWDLILVMEPLTIAGALMGAFLNKVLPEELLAVMLVLLLSATAYETLGKAIKMYKAETRAHRAQAASSSLKESELTRMAKSIDAEEADESSQSLMANMELPPTEPTEEKEDNEQGSSTQPDLELENVPIVVTPADELHQILEEEKAIPMSNIKLLVVMFLVVLFINLIKGGGAFPSPLGIRCGSLSFWMANAIMLIWILVISALARNYLIQRNELKQRVSYPYVEGDISWTPRATLIYPAVCCFAGFFAGMFGIGGGIVKGPLMLAMGVHPGVSSATSACMILFTSFTATTSFVVFGLLVEDYAVVCLGLGFVTTLLGQMGLSYIMKKSQRNSYIAFSIGGVVLLSAILMTIQSLVSLASRSPHNPPKGHAGVCG